MHWSALTALRIRRGRKVFMVRPYPASPGQSHECSHLLKIKDAHIDMFDGRPPCVRWHYRDHPRRAGVHWYAYDAAGISTTCEVLVNHFATSLPHGPVVQHRGQSIFARKNGQEVNFTASQWS